MTFFNAFNQIFAQIRNVKLTDVTFILRGRALAILLALGVRPSNRSEISACANLLISSSALALTAASSLPVVDK